MPREIKEIEDKLDASAAVFEKAHADDFHTYTVGQQTMQYVEVGHDPSKYLVLFVHDSLGDWKAWVEYLNDPYLIAVDRPGFGGS